MKKIINQFNDITKNISTFDLINTITILFAFPYLFLSMLILIFGDALVKNVFWARLFFAVTFLLMLVGFILGGIVMIIRSEVPGSIHFGGLFGKPARIFGIFQVSMMIIAIVILIIVAIDLWAMP